MEIKEDIFDIVCFKIKNTTNELKKTLCIKILLKWEPSKCGLKDLRTISVRSIKHVKENQWNFIKMLWYS